MVLVAYLAVVAWGTLGPEPGDEIDAAARRAAAAERAILGENDGAPSASSVAPSSSGDDVEDVGKRSPRFGSLTGEEAANVAMFVPFGLLVPLRFRRWWWATVLAGGALSCCIEGVQLTLLEHRSPSWNDVRWNTTGAVVGFAIWAALAGLWRSRADRH